MKSANAFIVTIYLDSLDSQVLYHTTLMHGRALRQRIAPNRIRIPTGYMRLLIIGTKTENALKISVFPIG